MTGKPLVAKTDAKVWQWMLTDSLGTVLFFPLVCCKLLCPPARFKHFGKQERHKISDTSKTAVKGMGQVAWTESGSYSWRVWRGKTA
jgi:hypothetical protein